MWSFFTFVQYTFCYQSYSTLIISNLTRPPSVEVKSFQTPFTNFHTFFSSSISTRDILKVFIFLTVNPLPHMPILDSSNSAENKNIISWIFANVVTSFWFSRKHCVKRRNCSLRAISPFPTMFSKAACCWCVKMSIYGVRVKELNVTVNLVSRLHLLNSFSNICHEIYI